MKKHILGILFVCILLVATPALALSPVETLAEANATIASLQAMITTLSAQIISLQAELTALKTKLGVSPEKSASEYANAFAKSADVKVAILSPNGGEIVQASTTMAIRWSGENIPDEGALTFALVDERGNNTYILNETQNTGSATVLLPEMYPGFYRLRVFCGIKGTDFYCSSDGTSATKGGAEDFSDGTVIITSAGPIQSGGGGGGNTSQNEGAAGTGGGSGSGAGPAITNIEMTSGNDYYFKGPATLQQIKDAGFLATGYPGNRPMELFTFEDNELPAATASAPNTYYIWDPSLRTDGLVLPSGWTAGWLKVGTGPTVYDPSTTKTTTYFIIRKDNSNTDTLVFTIPAGVTYFGTTPMNGSPRPRPWSMNHAPIAGNDTFERPHGISIKVNEQDLLANDTDSDDDTLSIIAVGSPTANGATVIFGEGIVLYTPPASFNGTDSFTYTVSDKKGESSTGTVTIKVGKATQGAASPISSSVLPNGSRLLRFSGLPGVIYTIQAATPGGHWDTLGTSQAGINGIYEFEDQSAVSLPNQTYRAIQ